MRSNRAVFALACCALLGGSSTAGRAAETAASEVDAWRVVDDLRRALTAAGPLVASFEQTYVPAGFTTGEKESGEVAMAFPDCLRWDYTTPYPRSYLVCGDTVYTWNQGEPTGRKQTIEPREEPGLDLILLSVEQLAARYTATSTHGREGTITIELAPKSAGEQIVEASLVVDPEAQRLRTLAYRDAEGDTTRFELTGYRGLDDRSRFSPPKEIRWQGE